MTRDDIQAKIEYFRQNVEELEGLPQSSFDEFMSDPRNLKTAIYLLQTSVQVLIDLCGYSGARLGLPTPPTSRGYLEAIESRGFLPPGSADRFGPMFAFRNRVVHLYDRIDPAIVYALLTQERTDLVELFGRLLDLLEQA
ncbi:MAG: DUF86 domain-containing protein [Planctomycetes bacterium]|nr:DUF86 domain-containing protein [Planctomycetota bacterium]